MKKLLWGLVVVSAIGTAWLLFSQEKARPRSEIIKFSHEYHQKVVGTECVDCHVQAPESTEADDNLLGSMQECGVCHDVDLEEECTLCHFADEETWVPFRNPERAIVFNHKLHVQDLALECETCHKNLNEVALSNAESLPKMTDCAACHENRQATLECANCHLSTLNLRPADHSADFLVTHKDRGRLDVEACAVCHTANDCSECHEGAALVTTGSGTKVDVLTPLFASVAGGTKGLLLTRVHEMNFRYTHPLQAAGRTTECAVCHEVRNFCQACHEAGGVDVAGKPLWHSSPDWGALAGVVGTGGGLHAQLARQDMEMCAACHSTQGDDPTCLLCHTDFDGVKGTNPKTHQRGFANRFGEHADFHSDPSAICFNCHTDTGQAGVGFCGYCHGPED